MDLNDCGNDVQVNSLQYCSDQDEINDTVLKSFIRVDVPLVRSSCSSVGEMTCTSSEDTPSAIPFCYTGLKLGERVNWKVNSFNCSGSWEPLLISREHIVLAICLVVVSVWIWLILLSVFPCFDSQSLASCVGMQSLRLPAVLQISQSPELRLEVGCEFLLFHTCDQVASVPKCPRQVCIRDLQ